MNSLKTILSPITRNNNCSKIQSYSIQQIKDSYLYDLRIDVSEYFNNIDTLDLYQCNDTGMRFFIPDTVEGNGDFYAQLQQYSWYYLPVKWEHLETFKYLPQKGKLLEIGCAKGAFLSMAKDKGISVEGIELNNYAAEQARATGLNVHTQMLDKFLNQGNSEKFDFVCAYQVLEHVADVKSFLDDAIACLKPGGTLFISVPDMNTFLKYDDGGILNFPPHHQGWYDHDVMRKLQNWFPIELVNVSTECLQKEHYNWFHKSMITKTYKMNKFIGALYFRSTLYEPFKKILIKLLASYVKGHTMMAVYRKK
jgi:2-polyprenyl-3-methyl-5-hydroxy-6-metoxy-1,4-benzoquinol methylase